MGERGERTAVLLTGVGKRYDIVSAFARHATVVARLRRRLLDWMIETENARPVPLHYDVTALAIAPEA